jgi:hypothetical protein
MSRLQLVKGYMWFLAIIIFIIVLPILIPLSILSGIREYFAVQKAGIEEFIQEEYVEVVL